MVMLSLLIVAGLSYLSGSVPTSIWIGKLVYKKDIRELGSGNAGATNVFRMLGWKPALFVVIVDVAKGLIPTLYFYRIRLEPLEIEPIYLQLLAGFAAILGHVWTVFAGFRGGKGVATAAGMLIALYPLAMPVCILVFAVVVGFTRYVSLGSMTAVTALPLTLLVFQYGFGRPVSTPLLILSFLVVAFIVFTHRSNIGRLLRGTESRLGEKSTGQAGTDN